VAADKVISCAIIAGDKIYSDSATASYYCVLLLHSAYYIRIYTHGKIMNKVKLKSSLPPASPAAAASCYAASFPNRYQTEEKLAQIVFCGCLAP
jgi:hypothetical protein